MDDANDPPASAGKGDEAYDLRELFYENLTAEDQQRFLRELEAALEGGLDEDAAWDRAWRRVEAEGAEGPRPGRQQEHEG